MPEALLGARAVTALARAPAATRALAQAAPLAARRVSSAAPVVQRRGRRRAREAREPVVDPAEVRAQIRAQGPLPRRAAKATAPALAVKAVEARAAPGSPGRRPRWR